MRTSNGPLIFDVGTQLIVISILLFNLGQGLRFNFELIEFLESLSLQSVRLFLSSPRITRENYQSLARLLLSGPLFLQEIYGDITEPNCRLSSLLDIARYPDLHPTIFSAMKLSTNPTLLEPFIRGQYDYAGILGKNDFMPDIIPNHICFPAIKRLIIERLPGSVESMRWVTNQMGVQQYGPSPEFCEIMLNMWYVFDPLTFITQFLPHGSSCFSNSLYDDFLSELMGKQSCDLDCQLRILKLIHSAATFEQTKNPLESSKWTISDILSRFTLIELAPYYDLVLSQTIRGDIISFELVWDRLSQAYTLSRDRIDRVKILAAMLDGLSVLCAILPNHTLLRYLKLYLFSFNVDEMLPGRTWQLLHDLTSPAVPGTYILDRLKQDIQKFDIVFREHQRILPLQLKTPGTRFEDWKASVIGLRTRPSRYLGHRLNPTPASTALLGELVNSGLERSTKQLYPNLRLYHSITAENGMSITTFRELLTTYIHCIRHSDLVFRKESKRTCWSCKSPNDCATFINSIPYFLLYGLQFPEEIWPAEKVNLLNFIEVGGDMKGRMCSGTLNVTKVTMAKYISNSLRDLQCLLGWPLIRQLLSESSEIDLNRPIGV
jgi:hypothetical protein